LPVRNIEQRTPAVIDKTTARELTPSTSRSFSFPVGYHDLHPDISINFQLNRFYGWVDDSMLTEMRHVVGGVNDYPTFTKIILDLGEKGARPNIWQIRERITSTPACACPARKKLVCSDEGLIPGICPLNSISKK
jgi:hypothetical protein